MTSGRTWGPARLRFPSLYWTLAGAFLLVLLLAIVLQGLVVLFVVEPVARRWTEERGRRAASEAAASLSQLFEEMPEIWTSPLLWSEVDREALEERVRQRLRQSVAGSSQMHLVFRGERPTSDGTRPWMVADHEMSRGMGRFLRGTLDTPAFAPRGPSPRLGRELEPQTSEPSRDGGPARDGSTRAGPTHRGIRVLGRSAVTAHGGSLGEVVAIHLDRGLLGWPLATPRPVLLFLPVALVLAGGAGLVLFRALVRRLRELEQLAARVAEGDLDARVENPGSDEIGRLGGQLNMMTERLSHARHSLEDADRQRRQLLADISHELATPLTSIRGFAETLQSGDVQLSDDERSAYLQGMLEASRRLDALIKDVLDLTRLEGGAIRLELERLDWRELCRNTVVRFRDRFESAGLALEWIDAGPRRSNDMKVDDPHAAETVPMWVEADGRRLEQVLENLLVNAMRYVPAGGRVEVSMGVAEVPGALRYALQVSDDGPGFPSHALPHVFERFYRGDPARTDGGTGLGLAIVREIVMRHGGEVAAANRTEGGAVLTVRMPAAAVES